MQAIILCGGKGTRLASLYADRPKVLVPIAGKPFLEWQLEWLARNGITDIHLAAGYKAEAIRQWMSQCGMRIADCGLPDMGQRSQDSEFRIPNSAIRITLSVETSPLGTAGGMKFVEPWIRSDPFLVVNGDTLLPNADAGFSSLRSLRTLRESSADGEEGSRRGRGGRREGFAPPAAIAVTRIEEAGRYGTVEFAADGLITAFREKASRNEGWVNGGVYLLRKSVLAKIAPGQNVSIETEVFPSLVRERGLLAFPCPPPLLDMGTPEGISKMDQWLTLPRSDPSPA